tara:strand:- start:194 stop:337 length:144 start_codon:yes stop_codon:yes gene_type:complete
MKESKQSKKVMKKLDKAVMMYVEAEIEMRRSIAKAYDIIESIDWSKE